MINHFIIALAVVVISFGPIRAAAEAFENCPVTVGSDNIFGAPFPEAESWYGSEALAVILPDDGIWGITGPKARIAVKLFIWSAGFEPGMEENISIEIESLSGNVNDSVVQNVSHAHAESLGGWTMLVGIDFPSPGCWQISADYLGQSLTFVVKTAEIRG